MATQEELTNLLSILYTNLNNLDSIYYDMFINSVPMDVTLERYDEAGVLQTYLLPNRAKDSQYILQGTGNPNGTISANTGVIYLDIASSSLYFKSIGTDTYGWVKVFSTTNLISGVNYLTPNGNGSQITNLNASNITSGMVDSAFLPAQLNADWNASSGLAQILNKPILDPDIVIITTGGTKPLTANAVHTANFTSSTTLTFPAISTTTKYVNMMLDFTLSSGQTLTLPTVTWDYAYTPTFSNTVRNRVYFDTIDNGSTWHASYQQKG